MKFESNLPIYTQIVQEIEHQIILGNYQPGQELPSRRKLATDWKINPNTVQKAFKEMEESGLIITEAQRASRVTQDLDKIKEVKDRYLHQSIHQLVDLLLGMDLPLNQAIDQIQTLYQRKKEGGPSC